LGEAKRTGKPILLSVGYAACHWCHVMAHESFENDAVARVMNELFVNIKVDRAKADRYGINASDPVIDGDLVFISTGYGKGAALFKPGAGPARFVTSSSAVPSLL